MDRHTQTGEQVFSVVDRLKVFQDTDPLEVVLTALVHVLVEVLLAPELLPERDQLRFCEVQRARVVVQDVLLLFVCWVVLHDCGVLGHVVADQKNSNLILLQRLSLSVEINKSLDFDIK